MSLNNKRDQHKIKQLRNTMQGYIGGSEVAELATDVEILALCDLQDQRARVHSESKALDQRYHDFVSHIKNRTV